MDIKAFVAETLTQILDGIREAQKRPGGEEVGAEGYGINSPNGVLMDGGRSGFFTTVEFDISVLAETKDGGGSVRVADSHITDGNSRIAQNASRVKFAVHVRLPKGGRNRDAGADYD